MKKNLTAFKTFVIKRSILGWLKSFSYMVPKHLKIYIFSLEHFHLLVFILFWDGNILIFWNALVSWKMFPVKLLSRLPLYVLFSPGRHHLEESRSLSMQDLHDLKDCRKELKSWFHTGSVDSEQSSMGSGCGIYVLYRMNPYVSTWTMSL